MDFTPTTKLAIAIINKLDTCQRGMGATETNVGALERSFKAAKSGTPIKNSSSGSGGAVGTSTTPGAGGGEAAGARRPSINFGVKDLAAMRRKSAAGADAAGAAGTPTVAKNASGGGAKSPTAAAASAGGGKTGTPTAKSSSSSSASKKGAAATPPATIQVPVTTTVETTELAEGWIEKFDKKSERYYYVNE